MITGYFNFSLHVADGWWDRQRFLRAWWRIYRGDRRWAPPYYPAWRDLLRADRHPHLQRLHPQMLHLEALPTRRRRDGSGGGSFGTLMFEEPVAATVLLHDDRGGARTAYLGELRVANDSQSVERFLGMIMEHLWQAGYQRFIGPVGLSPVLRRGVLMNHFDMMSPMHAAYNPPYVPEVLGVEMEILDTEQLFYVNIPDESPPQEGPVEIGLAGIRHTGSRLLPLLAACCDWPTAYPTPDRHELTYALRWLEAQGPLQALVARERGKMVGIALLQADQTQRLRRARGGRNLLWRWWLQWRRKYPVSQGCMIFGGVLPEERGRGIGSQLWAAALALSRKAGWKTLAVGPVAQDSAGAEVLQQWGGRPAQRYCVYTNEL